MDDLSFSSPQILIVDDQDDLQSPLTNSFRSRGYGAMALHPEEVTLDAVEESDLVLVDYQLNEWQARDTAPDGRKPRTGISLLAILRDQTQVSVHRPIGFALNTARFRELPNSLPPPVTKHALARAYNFEWIFDKESSTDVDAICSLASACRALPTDWDSDNSEELFHTLLQLPEAPWAEVARVDAIACRPPIHELSTSTDGLAFIRWILHRILPYPCFLHDHNSLAVRLGITTAELSAVVASDSQSSESLFDPLRYSGILDTFAGPRWWRSGVEALLWEQTGSRPFDADLVRSFVSTVSPVPLHSTPPDSGVLAIDEQYEYIGAPIEIADAIRIQPDDWPSYADDAWTPQALLKQHKHLRLLVN